MSNINYTPSKTLVPFLTSEAFVSLVSGPIGSGKSSAAMLKIAYHAKRMRAGKDGIRRSRAVIVRNTNQMLTDSTLPTFTTWFPEGPAGIYARTDKRFHLRFDDVHCEVLFRGLDDANDVRRLLSLECSFGILDEFREIHPDIFSALQGRVGRYPSVANGGCVTDDGKPNHHIWGATNAPDADTFWEQYMTDPPSTAEIFMQPSALSPEADWAANLVEGYYQTLAEGKSQDWVDVYIHNKFGKSLSGTPVFSSFSPGFHVADQPLHPILNGMRPLLIGMDFGLNPSAVLGQLDARGRMLVYESLTSDGMGILRFIQTILKPALAERYPGAPVLVIGDPAGTARVQTDEKTVYDILRQEGFKAIPAYTNSLAARITAVDQFLCRQIDGGPGFLIDPSARQLITALRSKYRYKVKTNGELEDKPEKNEASHYCDALQYLCLHADAQQGGKFANRRAHTIERVPMGAWT